VIGNHARSAADLRGRLGVVRSPVLGADPGCSVQNRGHGCLRKSTEVGLSALNGGSTLVTARTVTRREDCGQIRGYEDLGQRLQELVQTARGGPATRDGTAAIGGPGLRHDLVGSDRRRQGSFALACLLAGKRAAGRPAEHGRIVGDPGARLGARTGADSAPCLVDCLVQA
jgi:hypothetical protein